MWRGGIRISAYDLLAWLCIALLILILGLTNYIMSALFALLGCSYFIQLSEILFSCFLGHAKD